MGQVWGLVLCILSRQVKSGSERLAMGDEEGGEKGEFGRERKKERSQEAGVLALFSTFYGKACIQPDLKGTNTWDPPLR